MSRELLSESERAAIEAAVKRAEAASGAEIVPVLAAASGDYPVAAARAAALGALLGALFALFLPEQRGWIETSQDLRGVLATFGGAAVGLLLSTAGAFRRFFAGAEIDERVDLVAESEFLERGVFRTAERTGLLIFVSIFEHRVRVLADQGVYAAVSREKWDALAAEVAGAMRDLTPGEAMLRAVERAGALVTEFGPRRRPDDVDELEDGVRVRD